MDPSKVDSPSKQSSYEDDTLDDTLLALEYDALLLLPSLLLCGGGEVGSGGGGGLPGLWVFAGRTGASASARSKSSSNGLDSRFRKSSEFSYWGRTGLVAVLRASMAKNETADDVTLRWVHGEGGLSYQ